MSDNKVETKSNFVEYEITDKSEESLACEWDNYLNDGFDIFSVNNGLTTQEIVSSKSPAHNEINVDNAMNFSFQNDTDAINPQTDQDKQGTINDADASNCNDLNSITNKEKEKEVVNCNLLDGFLRHPKIYDNDEEMSEKVEKENGKNNNEINKESLSNPTFIFNNDNEHEVNENEEKDKEVIANEGTESNIFNRNKFDSNEFFICNSVNSIDILIPIISFQHIECQTEIIQLESSSHHNEVSTFTIPSIKKHLSINENESFSYTNSIQSRKDNSHQNILSFTISSNKISNEDNTNGKLLKSKNIIERKNSNSKHRYNDINIRYNDSEESSQHNSGNQYVIHAVYWFSVKNNIYYDYLRKDYKDADIIISKEISVYLKKSDCLGFELSSRSVPFSPNRKDGNYNNNNTPIYSENESMNRNMHSIEQLTHSELSAMNNHQFNSPDKSNKINRSTKTKQKKISSKPIMIRFDQSNHLSRLLSEETFHSAKAQAIRLPFDFIENINSNKPCNNNNNTSVNLDDSSLNDSNANKEKELQKLKKQLNSFRYQNKIITDENKKLLEVINIFKMLSSLEKSDNEKGKTNENAKEKSESKSKSNAIIDDEMNNKNDINTIIEYSNKKSDSLDDIEKRLSSFSNNQCTIPLQIKLLDNYTTTQDTNTNYNNHKKNEVLDPNAYYQNASTEGYNNHRVASGKMFSNMPSKQNERRKRIVQQLESILDNVKNEELKIYRTVNNRLGYRSLPLVTTDVNKKTTTDCSNKNAVVNLPNDKIPFHLISQRKLYENLIKSISMQKDHLKHYK